MIPYATRTGTLRNVAAMKAHGWRMLLTPAGDLSAPPLPYALDNGAWGCFQRGQPIDIPGFLRLVGLRSADADFVVAPDIVAGGLASLAMSRPWIDPLLAGCRMVLIAVQDGIEPEHVADLVGPRVGLFLGGSTDWKLARMKDWGDFAAERGCYYHVARVNTAKRTYMAAGAGADSIDGTSATRFAKTIPMLDGARRQPDLLAPKRRSA